MSAAVAIALKDQHVDSTAITDKYHNVLRTAPSEYLVPLIAAPVLPLESLASVKTITISLLSSNATSATRFKYRDIVHVSRVRLYSHTKMSFYLLGGDELRIW